MTIRRTRSAARISAVDPSDFKAYIFPLLFYKPLSDGWDEEHAHALADYGGEETLAALPENRRFQIPEECHWRDLRRVHENVGVALQRMLDRIQETNAETQIVRCVTARPARSSRRSRRRRA